MNIQRLRNLTTGRLHTSMSDVVDDIEMLFGSRGITTLALPPAREALLPYLREVAPDPRLWDGAYDETHVGEIDVPPVPAHRLGALWASFYTFPV